MYTDLMSDALQILLVEDNLADAELIVLRIKQEGLAFEWRRVETEPDYLAALDPPPDLILADWSLPQFSGMRAFQLMQERGLDIPFIIVSGSIGEETAVAAMHMGVNDYLLKDRPQRLVQAIRNALEQKQMRQERQNAETALAASEAELRALFDAMHDLVLVLDREGIYLKVAPTRHVLLYKPAQELLGKSLKEVFPPEEAEQFTRAIQNVLKTRRTQTIEYQLVIQDNPVWFETSISPLNADSVVWVARDVTERKITEAVLNLQSSALNAAANAIVITDRDGVIEWVNPAFTKLTGYEFDEALGKNPSQLVKSGRHEPGFYQRMWETILSGQVWQGEMINRRKDGQLYTEEQTITPLPASDGKITQFIAIKQDITKRKQAEEALQRKSRVQEWLAAFGCALSTSLDLDDIYRTVESHLKQMVDCPNIGITLIDPKKEVLEAAYISSDGVLLDLHLFPPWKFKEQPSPDPRAQAILEKSPIIANDLDTTRKITGGLQVGGRREPQSALYLPMVVEGQTIGLLELQSNQPQAYTQEQVEWLSVAAHQLGLTIQNARHFRWAQQRLEELSAVHAIDSAVTRHLDLQQTFEILVEQAHTRLGVDAAAVLLFVPDTQELVYAFERGFHTQAVQETRVSLGQSLAGQAALEKRLVQSSDLQHEGEELIRHPVWQAEGFSSYFASPLLVEDVIIGVLEVFHRSSLTPDDDWLRFLQILAGQTAIAIDSNRLFEDLRLANVEILTSYETAIEGWSQAMDLRDKETEGHTRRVTEMTLSLARSLGVPEKDLVHIRRGALLHDIGKLGVPDHILLKPGPLTDDEWVLMKQHPVNAYRMLSQNAFLQPALDIPYCHHEKWDGSGYPRELQGIDIPLAARIFAVVDVWDALTSHRPYRPAWTPEKALDYIREQSGQHFDPQVAAAFFDFVHESNLISR
jgi:PAS domain S-box-containing protein/putative nucleotidyltransferase with HDIG domain